MGELRRIGFSLNLDNDAARETLTRAESWCSGHGVEAWSSSADDADGIDVKQQAGSTSLRADFGVKDMRPAKAHVE